MTNTTIDHIGINVANYEKSKKFYIAALKPLGVTVMQDFGTVIGMGAQFPYLWISEGAPGHMHLAFRADSRALVDEFYAAAIKAGGKDNGKPGLRTEYHQHYYAAFIHDMDGHNIECVCHEPK